MSPGAYDFIDLDIWPDVGTAVLSIEETRLRCARALKPDGIVRTWMDEMAFRLLNGGDLERICVAMVKDRGSRFVNPTVQTKYPCEFCGTRDYLDCYHLCMECCGPLLDLNTLGSIDPDDLEVKRIAALLGWVKLITNDAYNGARARTCRHFLG